MCGREGRKEVSLSLSFEVGWAETWGSSRIGQREREREKLGKGRKIERERGGRVLTVSRKLCLHLQS